MNPAVNCYNIVHTTEDRMIQMLLVTKKTSLSWTKNRFLAIAIENESAKLPKTGYSAITSADNCLFINYKNERINTVTENWRIGPSFFCQVTQKNVFRWEGGPTINPF